MGRRRKQFEALCEALQRCDDAARPPAQASPSKAMGSACPVRSMANGVISSGPMGNDSSCTQERAAGERATDEQSARELRWGRPAAAAAASRCPRTHLAAAVVAGIQLRHADAVPLVVLGRLVVVRACSMTARMQEKAGQLAFAAQQQQERSALLPAVRRSPAARCPHPRWASAAWTAACSSCCPGLPPAGCGAPPRRPGCSPPSARTGGTGGAAQCCGSAAATGSATCT